MCVCGVSYLLPLLTPWLPAEASSGCAEGPSPPFRHLSFTHPFAHPAALVAQVPLRLPLTFLSSIQPPSLPDSPLWVAPLVPAVCVPPSSLSVCLLCIHTRLSTFLLFSVFLTSSLCLWLSVCFLLSLSLCLCLSVLG